MNRKQEICLGIGISIVLLMELFPPVKETGFERTFLREGGVVSTTHINYEFLFNADGPVAISNILVQWIFVAVITGSLIYIFREKKSKAEKENNQQKDVR